MRPIRITMTAFGPYRDAETIDFGQLGDRRLFVISGNTGAGKTTIFDGICYALYGSASGEDRAETRMLRSHFAEDDVHTSIDYTFRAGSKTYRVFRQMPHRRGGNKNETGGKAELYEATPEGEIPAVDRFTVSDVNAKLEAIIGLSREQFGQIVMLPQGEFRKLLTSDTENKEEILRRIFRTGLYQKIEERFYRQNRELQDALKQASAMQGMYVKQTRETLPVREGSALEATLAQEYSSMTQVSEGLAEEIAFYEARFAEIANEKGVLDGRLAAQEAELREALAAEARFALLAEKRKQQDELERRKPEFAESERLVRLAEQAARIEPYEEQALAAGKLAAEKREAQDRKRKDAAEARLGFAAAEERHRSEGAREAERKAAEVELARLGELAPVVRTLEQRRLEVERLAAEERALSAKREDAEGRIAAAKTKRRELAERLKQAETEAAKLPEALQRVERMRGKYKLLKELADLEARLAEHAKLEAGLAQAARLLKEDHDRQETAWLEGQAGLLAVHLHDGKPCPVCGSESHPAKASADPGSVPSREALQVAKDKLRIAERELEEARAQAAAAGAGRNDRAESAAEYGVTGEPFAEQLVRAEAEGKGLRAETDRLKQSAEAAAGLRLEAEKLDAELERQQAERERAVAAHQLLLVDRSAKQSVLESETGRVPEELRAPGKLEARISEQAALVGRLNDAWRQAQERLRQAQATLVEATTNAAQAEVQAVEAEGRSKEAGQRFAGELAKSGFADPERYRSAKMAEADRTKLQTLLEEFKSRLATLAQQIGELERELSGRARPIPEAIRERMAATKAETERVVAELHRTNGLGQEARRLLSAIRDSAELFRELERKQEQVADVYQMLKGDNALKISFERYILIEFLEQIIQSANVRLEEMSGGQFRLERSDRLETRGKQSGLGLDVYDAYTGQNRDVKSMSGGEKFNASLCLALGMTDVIQSYQGGVSIEMMFIDEGFGSLDEDSLNKAISTLVDLQRTGRMIGVISHVQELKAAFPAALEVTKSKDGRSRTAFVLK